MDLAAIRDVWNRHRLTISLLLLTLIALGAAEAFYIASRWSEIRPKLSHYKQRIQETDSRFTDAVNKIAAHVQSIAHANESEKLDYIRKWVNRNSIHIGNEQQFPQSQPRYAVPLLWKRHVRSGDAPTLGCGGRTYAMKAILNKLGIKSRIVDVFSDPQDSHTFLEVWNTDTGSWEIQDPDIDVSYRHIRSLKRVPVFQMVMGDIDQVEPFNESGHGWYLRRGLKPWFRVAVYRLSYEGHRSIAIVNPDIPIARRNNNDANTEIADYLKKQHYDPVIFDGAGIMFR